MAGDLQVLMTTSLNAVRPVMGAGGGAIYELSLQFRELFRDHDAALIFAQPKETRTNSGEPAILWQTAVPGTVRRLDGLTENERAKVLIALRNCTEQLTRVIESNEKYRREEKLSILSALENAFEIPSLDHLYSVGGKPVLAGWGFVSNSWDAPRSVIRKALAGISLPTVDLVVQVVRQSTEEGVPGVAVTVMDGVNPLPSPPETDAQGTTRMRGLPEGSMVKIEARLEQRRVATARASLTGSETLVRMSILPETVLEIVEASTRAPLGGFPVQVSATDADGVVLSEHRVTGVDGRIGVGPLAVEGVKLHVKGANASYKVEEILEPRGSKTHHVVIARKEGGPHPNRRMAGWLIAAALLLLTGAGGLAWGGCHLPWGPASCSPALALLVLDKESGVPLPDVHVEVHAPQQTTTFDTDGQGKVSIRIDSPEGSVRTVFSKAGYETYDGPLPCCGPEEQTILLAPVHTQSVRVVSMDGAPMPGANVTLGADGTKFAMATDADGRAVFTSSQPIATPLHRGGALSVHAAQKGFEEATGTGVCCQSEIVLTLYPRYVIDGLNDGTKHQQSGMKVLGIVPPGATEIYVKIDDNGADDDIVVFTRSGKQLVGAKIGTGVWAAKTIAVMNATDVGAKIFPNPGFSGPVFDDSNLNQGPIPWKPGLFEKTNSSGMTIEYSGSGFKAGKHLEELKIDRATEPLIILIVGEGEFIPTSSWKRLDMGE